MRFITFTLLFTLLLTPTYAGITTCSGCCAVVCGPAALTFILYLACVATCVSTAGVVCPAPPVCIPICIAPIGP